MTHLAGAREFRCCYEILQTRGKFTFIGLDAGCILNHPDFAPKQTVLFLSRLDHFFAITMGDIIEEGMVQLKISEYDEIVLIYPKLEELTCEPLPKVQYKRCPRTISMF